MSLLTPVLPQTQNPSRFYESMNTQHQPASPMAFAPPANQVGQDVLVKFGKVRDDVKVLEAPELDALFTDLLGPLAGLPRENYRSLSEAQYRNMVTFILLEFLARRHGRTLSIVDNPRTGEISGPNLLKLEELSQRQPVKYAIGEKLLPILDRLRGRPTIPFLRSEDSFREAVEKAGYQGESLNRILSGDGLSGKVFNFLKEFAANIDLKFDEAPRNGLDFWMKALPLLSQRVGGSGRFFQPQSLTDLFNPEITSDRVFWANFNGTYENLTGGMGPGQFAFFRMIQAIPIQELQTRILVPILGDAVAEAPQSQIRGLIWRTAQVANELRVNLSLIATDFRDSKLSFPRAIEQIANNLRKLTDQAEEAGAYPVFADIAIELASRIKVPLSLGNTPPIISKIIGDLLQNPSN